MKTPAAALRWLLPLVCLGAGTLVTAELGQAWGEPRHPGAALCLGVAAVLLAGGCFNQLLYVAGACAGRQRRRTQSAPRPAEPALEAKVALVMPIYHEDTEQVFRGVRCTWLSCRSAGLAQCYDFYLLSDSTDPALCCGEEALVRSLQADFGHPGDRAGRLFLQRRSDRANFKAGNIMNFLDRQGIAYDFMLVLDADSVMLGATLRRLIISLQTQPRTAILQTLMLPIRACTPFARALQYSTTRCLPPYARGMRWFWGEESVYWGHNALIRVAPFREHCRLPTLPGQPPWGGPILSQDIVEAALLGRAGWEIRWDVGCGGSFDELPANLLTYGNRDRRWCQGNFQHARFLFARGIKFGHRLYFANGIWAYLAGPLALLLFVIGLVRGWLGTLPAPDPWLLSVALGLFWAQMLLPRALGLLELRRGCPPGADESTRSRGPAWLPEVASMLTELALSLLVAPALFWLHTRFVVAILTGGHVTWRSQSRDPRQRVGWASAARVLWCPTVLGLWGMLAVGSVPLPLAVGMLPMLLGLAFSIPCAVVTSDARLGRRLADLGLFPDHFSREELLALGGLINGDPTGRLPPVMVGEDVQPTGP